MKKTRAFIFTLSILALSLGAFAACGNTKNNTDKGNTNANNVLAFSAASTGVILDTAVNSKPAASSAEETATGGTVPETSTQPDVNLEEIKNYVAIVENFIGTNPLTVTEEKSDIDGFETKMTVVSRDIAGNSYTYTMYFNETALTDKSDEVRSAISGKMLHNGTEYAVEGIKEIEGDEYEISLTAKLDENNYVKIEQETETEETSFKYEIYENGVMTNSFELEIETEQDETEVELTTLKDGATEVFKFERELENGEEYIKVTTVKDGVQKVIQAYVVNNSDGTVSYKIVDDGKEETFEKPDYDDDDDDDDEHKNN